MKKPRESEALLTLAPPVADAATSSGTLAIDTLQIETRDISALIPYARNARLHDEQHVAQLAASIREWGWTFPVLIDELGGIIAGHGRVLAARKLGIERVPVIVARGWSEAKKRAYILADNKLAINAKWDRELLAGELAELAPFCELALTGFSATELGRLLDAGGLDGSAMLGDGLVYHVIVDCSDETQQSELLAKLQGEGLTCRALIA